ncbi:YciI family protein [Luteibacter sahnii]|uniref:YciI family protein n=1 Tax=Luteibacter sahnii TaxID=3021977 RepID=UPI002A6B8976|nr:YciI family protein [Luteibacter sp. PPL193]MDY1547088.1 YciI family protein [Luteibacter sp. PPL193]
MLYIVTLTYSRPKVEVDGHLDAHRSWLVEQVRAGRVLAAGPIDTGLGGLILAHAENRSTLDAALVADPFYVHGVADFHVQPFSPALRANMFPAAWAVDAKAV